MPSTNSEIRQLLGETVARYPHQNFGTETLKAYFEDWCAMCKEFGLKRFTEGVKRARSYSEFFPMEAKIRELIPEARNQDIEFTREMADLKRRKAAGEKFYSLADVLKEFARRVIAGEIKGRDARGQQALSSWAEVFQRDYAAYAAKMLS